MVLEHLQLLGASSNHSGIDIAATENTKIYAVLGGIVTFTGFKGAGGYTITIHNNEFDISYCHVSPNFIITENDIIEPNTIIGFVGPKYISEISNNPYHDSSRKTNQRSNYRLSFTLNNKKRRHSRQSFKLF